MSRPWAVCLPLDAAPSAAGLRLEPGIEVLDNTDAIWLRGDAADERTQKLLLQLPGAQRFEVLSSGDLRPLGSRLPGGRLPAGVWKQLKDWGQIELPAAAFAARIDARIPLKLVRTTGASQANVLATTLAEWAAYGGTAPQVRLRRWRFAVSAEGAVIVHGNPLPPLPGVSYVEQSSVAVPCGWGWSPAVEAELLRNAWNLAPDDLALVAADGTWEHLRGDQFVHATRSAIRDSATKTENEGTVNYAD